MSTLPPILKLNMPRVLSHLLRESLGLYVKGSKFHVLGFWVPMVRSVGQGLCFVQWLGAVSWVFKGCLWWHWDRWACGLQWLSVLVGGRVAFLAKAVVVGGGVGFYTCCPCLFGRGSWQCWRVCEGRRRRRRRRSSGSWGKEEENCDLWVSLLFWLVRLMGPTILS